MSLEVNTFYLYILKESYFKLFYCMFDQRNSVLMSTGDIFHTIYKPLNSIIHPAKVYILIHLFMNWYLPFLRIHPGVQFSWLNHEHLVFDV